MVAKKRAVPLPWLKPAVITGALVPLAVMLLRAAAGTLGGNPISRALNDLGLLALVLLIASLACTPAKDLLGWTWPVRIRRNLGVLAFAFALLHFLTYVVLDQAFDLKAVAQDILKRPFILVGFVALVLLTPLAITSTDAMVRKLGFARWKKLHRLAYVAGVLGVIHFVWRVKKDITEPALYGIVLGLLLVIRVAESIRSGARKSKPRPGSPAGA